MFASIDDDDHYDLYMEGGDDKAKTAPAAAAAAPADTEANKDPTLDVHGLKKHAPREFV